MALLRRLLVPLIFFVGQYLYARLKFFGAFRFSTQPISHYVPTGNYFAIPEIVLAEDIAVHKPSGQLILFGQTEFRQRTGWWPAWAVFDRVEDGMSARGKLWSVDPKSLKPSEIKLVDFDEPFTNHGIDIYPSPSDDNVFYLHAINHPPEVIDGKPTDQASSRIEVFIVNIKTREAKHQRSVHHPLIKRPNDIYSISPTEFLVTNDHHNSRGLLRLLEDFITLSIASWTDVVHVKFDSEHPEHASSAKGTQQKPFLDTAAGVTAKLVATRLHNANGLARGPGNNEVIVADASGGHMTSFIWSAAAETLENKRGILTDLPIDNPVYFDDPYATPASNASGYVIAGLLSGIHLDKQSRDPEARIPSSLWLAKETEGGGIKKHLLFEDDGNFVSGAATAVLLPIDPATLKGTKDEGKRLGWAVITGPWSRQAGAVKVDLTEWTKV